MLAHAQARIRRELAQLREEQKRSPGSLAPLLRQVRAELRELFEGRGPLLQQQGSSSRERAHHAKNAQSVIDLALQSVILRVESGAPAETWAEKLERTLEKIEAQLDEWDREAVLGGGAT